MNRTLDGGRKCVDIYFPRLCMQDSRKPLKNPIKKRNRKGIEGGEERQKKSNPITGLGRP